MNAQPAPAIVCEYGQMELPRVLSELDILVKGLLPGGVLHLSTEQPGAVDAIPAWCRATGNKVIGQTVIRSCGPGGSVVEYLFDIERGNRHVYPSSLP
ncbi:MAG TPA: hypothetical protein VFU32_10090 [Ktedonobacterales bacterium]|nr:hypothetical protein [Ktedonobacterales bacterium]